MAPRAVTLLLRTRKAQRVPEYEKIRVVAWSSEPGVAARLLIQRSVAAELARRVEYPQICRQRLKSEGARFNILHSTGLKDRLAFYDAPGKPGG